MARLSQSQSTYNIKSLSVNISFKTFFGLVCHVTQEETHKSNSCGFHL